METPPPYGFIVSRHIATPESAEYWKECCACIRAHYPPTIPIIIIDNGSPHEYCNLENDRAHAANNAQFGNCQIIASETPNAGEMSPYYYFWKSACFQKAVIIHDSLFMNAHTDFSQFENRFLFTFTARNWDNREKICEFLDTMKCNAELRAMYYHNQWVGCFGVQSVVTHDYICKLQDRYELFNVIPYITDKDGRETMERVFGIVATTENPKLKIALAVFGDIYLYMRIPPVSWTLRFADWIRLKNDADKREMLDNYPVIKAFQGR